MDQQLISVQGKSDELPASGKVTWCANLVNELGYCHISTGDLFRAENGQMAEPCYEPITVIG